MPRTRSCFVGYSNGNSVEIANKFKQNWSTDLIVGTNDCSHYTNGKKKMKLAPQLNVEVFFGS